MTPRQMQTLRQWWPIVSALVMAGMIWATLKRDVAESVRIPRFEAESLKVRSQLNSHDRRIDRLETSVDNKLDALCRALAANCPPR